MTDAEIHIKFVDGYEDQFYDITPPECEIKPLSEHSYERKQGATHFVENNWRYYGPVRDESEHCPHYFDFPHIAACLMVLLADPCVEKVWYNGDNTDVLEPCDKAKFLAMCTYFLEHSGTHKVY